MLENGFVRLYRSMLSWEWYNDINTKVLFIHLLLTVNYYDQQWRGITVKRGQRVYTREKLAAEIGVSERAIRTAINHLISTGEVTNQTGRQYSMISVVRFDQYQQATNETTNERPTNDQPTTDDRPVSKKARKQEEKNTGDSAPEKKAFGEFGKVWLTDEQHDRLVQRLGKDGAAEYIERLDGYISSTGKRYTDHCATILNWWRKDRDKPKTQNKSAQTGESSLDMDKIRQLLHGVDA